MPSGKQEGILTDFQTKVNKKAIKNLPQRALRTQRVFGQDNRIFLPLRHKDTKEYSLRYPLPDRGRGQAVRA